MIYGYVRVSSKKQLEGNGLQAQKNEIFDKYKNAEIIEEQYTATKKDRPKFNDLMGDLKRGDLLVVSKLDRLARNTVEGIDIIESLFTKGVSIHVLNIGLLENTTMGRFFITTLLAVAEMERNMIIERTQAGKEIAKQDLNYKEGRPVKYKKEQKQHALELLNQGITYKQVEAKTGISKSTLIRYKRSMEEEQALKEMEFLKEKEKEVKKIKTNRDKIEGKLSSMNLVLGCYDNLVDKLTSYQLKKVLDALPFASTDVHVSINKKKYVVEINEVDNEIDFEVIDIGEYVSRYGELED